MLLQREELSVLEVAELDPDAFGYLFDRGN
jgi:hypothetical protein